MASIHSLYRVATRHDMITVPAIAALAAEKLMRWIMNISGFVAATIGPLGTMAANAEPQTGRALPDDPTRAVNICMAATHPINENGKIRLRDSIEASWYLLQGIRENPRAGSLEQRLAAFPNPDPAEAEVGRDEAPQLINLCQQRWHNSHRGAIEIMLPVDSFKRDVQCYSITSFVHGMVGSELVTDDDGLGIKIAKKLAAYESRLTVRAYENRGLSKASKRDAFLEKQTLDAVDLGNINDVIDACLKTSN